MKQQPLPFIRKHRLLKIAATVFALIVVAYLFFCPRLNEQFVSQLLFHPLKSSGRQADLELISGVVGEEVFFSNLKNPDSPQLNGWLYTRPNAKLIVVFNHGNTGNISTRKWKLESLLNSGVSLFVYDYRGFGRSDGHPTVTGVIEDAVAAVDYLIGVKGFSASNIVLYGESLGSCISSELARRRHYRGVVIQSGCVSAERLCKEQVPVLNVYPSALFFRPSLSNLEFVKGSHPPILIMAGKLDELIPVTHAHILYEQASNPKRLIILPNSSHNEYQRDLDSFNNALRVFFESLENEKTD